MLVNVCYGGAVGVYERMKMAPDGAESVAAVFLPDAVADPGMIFTLLEQLVEGSTLANCQDLFVWVERRRDTLNQESLWKRGKVGGPLHWVGCGPGWVVDLAEGAKPAKWTAAHPKGAPRRLLLATCAPMAHYRALRWETCPVPRIGKLRYCTRTPPPRNAET